MGSLNMSSIFILILNIPAYIYIIKPEIINGKMISNIDKAQY